MHFQVPEVKGINVQIKAVMDSLQLVDEARGDLAVGIPNSYDLGFDSSPGTTKIKLRAFAALSGPTIYRDSATVGGCPEM